MVDFEGDSRSKVITIPQVDLEKNEFEKNLRILAQPKFGRCLLVGSNGKIQETNFLWALFEKLKGLFGGCNHTNQSLVEFSVIHFFVQGIKNGWLKKEDLERVNSLARRAGLTSFGAEADGKHKELHTLVQLIKRVVNGEGQKRLIHKRSLC